MRKRSFLQVFDFVAWFMIGLLPIIYALFTCVYSSNGIITINSFTSAIDTFLVVLLLLLIIMLFIMFYIFSLIVITLYI